MNKQKPFFIAELSANHGGDFNLAKKLIKCLKNISVGDPITKNCVKINEI
jgi:sialic acid synthase SpsE